MQGVRGSSPLSSTTFSQVSEVSGLSFKGASWLGSQSGSQSMFHGFGFSDQDETRRSALTNEQLEIEAKIYGVPLRVCAVPGRP
jgi:hypothetical protein